MTWWLWIGCSKPAPMAWEALDVPELERRIANPTATVASLRGRLDEALALIRAAVEIQRLPTGGLAGVLAGPESEAPPLEAVVAGTSFFVQVACPGPADSPDPDFAYGMVDLDSPLLVTRDFRPLVGPILVQLHRCELGPVQLDGLIRARWIPDQARLVASGALAIEAQGRVLAVRSDLDVRQDGIALRVPMGDGFATIAVDGSAAELRFADAVVACSLDADLSCEEP